MTDLLKRVRALLALGQSENQHEAANAMAAAQRLMVENDLTMTQVHSKETDEGFLELPAIMQNRMPGWKRLLAFRIANASDCVLLKTGGNGYPVILSFVGVGLDTECARSLLEYALSEIERHTFRECKGKGQISRNSFRRGMVDEIGIRLQSEREVLRAKHGTALALRETRKERVAQWVKRNGDVKQSRRINSHPKDLLAYLNGRACGKRVDLNSKKLSEAKNV